MSVGVVSESGIERADESGDLLFVAVDDAPSAPEILEGEEDGLEVDWVMSRGEEEASSLARSFDGRFL